MRAIPRSAGAVSSIDQCWAAGVLAFVLFYAPTARSQSQKVAAPDAPAPHNVTAAPLKTASAQNAASLVKQEQFAAARTQLESLLRDHPDDVDARFLLGYVLYRQGHFADSLGAYTAGARLRTPTTEELVVVASDYIQLRAYADAVRWLSYVTEHAPANAGAWYLLGRTEYLQDQQEAALVAFRRCLSLQPRDIRAQYNAGLALERLQRPAEAEAAYREAISWSLAQHDRDPQPWLDLGDLLLTQGKLQDAVEVLAEAVHKAPSNAFCQQQLGVALLTEGRNEDALVPLQRALALAPNAERVHFYIARAYKALGHKAQADAEFAVVARLFQTHEGVDTPNPDVGPPLGGDVRHEQD